MVRNHEASRAKTGPTPPPQPLPTPFTRPLCGAVGRGRSGGEGIRLGVGRKDPTTTPAPPHAPHVARGECGVGRGGGWGSIFFEPRGYPYFMETVKPKPPKAASA